MTKFPTRRLLVAGAGAAALAGALLATSSCSSPIPNRNPVGERFPSVTGTSLDGVDAALPEDLVGAPALLIVGYVQDAQFDIDRWILGLVDGAVDVRAIEVPTVRGLVPRLISGTIDQGMRNGIPDDLWGDVITVYGDADAIAEFTGTERPRNGRVLLLDREGRVVWFHDAGYAAQRIPALRAAVEAAGG